MTITSDKLLSLMSDIRFEPTRLNSIQMENLEAAFDGETLMVDPSLPFPSLVEASVVMTYGAIQRDEILNSRDYSVMAVSDEDLYFHLSDKDYEGMFATPAEGWFDIYIAEDEVLSTAVPVGNTGTKRLTIPKHSQIVVNNTPFTFQYPINFLVKTHGAIDVIYDGSKPSPLQTLRGNKVKNDIVTTGITANNGGPVRLIRLTVKLKQMLLTSYTYSLTASKSLKKVLTLTDEFYYVRAFSRLSSGLWDEIKTTRSQQVFDPTDPTLLYKVIEDELTIELPYVYYLTNLVTRDLRIDVYTTKGDINMSLSGLSPDAFVATWRDLDEDDSAKYYAVLPTLATVSIISTEVISGGTAAPSFEERRARVLNNAVGDAVIPISDAQMGTALAELGFDSQAVVDDVTERTYLASRAMPNNLNGQSSTGVDAAVITMKTAISDIINLETVIDNGQRFTLTPKTLYRNIDGVLSIVSDADRKAIDLLTGDALSNRVNDGTYLYTPLHYVLDISDNEFHVRPYFLDSPEIDVTSYEGSNNSLGLTISAGTAQSIVRDEFGYLITIQSSSNAAWQALADDQVHVQLAFKPSGESDYAYINGRQISKSSSGERIYQFRLDTHWDISPDHLLTLTNFSMYEPIQRDYPTTLQQDFSLIWAVSDFSVLGGESSDVDDDLGEFLLPDGAIGVYHETVSITLGDELSGLWARARSMIGLRKYVTYQVNVPAVWEQNFYAKDENGQPIIEGTGTDRHLKVQFAKGSPVLDADGKQTYKHRAGEAVLDEHGNPILESERNVIRWWDVVLFDAVYRYATDLNDAAYMADAPKVLVDWINDVLGGVREELIERTDLLFQPRNTLKFVECLVEDSELKTLHTAQTLTIDFYVSKDVYADNDIRKALESTAIAAVVAGLDNIVVSRNNLEAAIKAVAGTDIVSIHLSGLGGEVNDYNVITLLDESSRLCVAKSLIAQADGTHAVVDAIHVNFKRHASA